MTIDNTMTKEYYQGFLNQKEEGNISIKSHDEDENLVILNYTNACVFKRDWNEYTMRSRGLILDISKLESTGLVYIVSEPFEKFFNYNENLEYQNMIDLTEQPKVFEKMDGSLGISYFVNGEMRIATRGSFHSEQAEEATRMLDEKYSDLRDKYKLVFPDNSITLIFEIIYPENRIVVNYGNESKLVILGIKRTDGTDYDYEDVKQVAKYLGLEYAKEYDLSINKMLELKKTIGHNDEGWILRFSNGKRLKIKGDEYLRIHKSLYGMSDKERFKYWCDGKENDMLRDAPEEFRKELESLFEFLNNYHNHIKMNALIKYYYVTKDNSDMGKKELAQAIVKEDSIDKSLMFDRHDGTKFNDDTIYNHMYKNYREILKIYNGSMEV